MSGRNRGMATDEQLAQLTADARAGVKDLNQALAELRKERASIIAGAREAMRDEAMRLINEMTRTVVQDMRRWTDKQLGFLNDSMREAGQLVAAYQADMAEALATANVEIESKDGRPVLVVSFSKLATTRIESYEHITNMGMKL